MDPVDSGPGAARFLRHEGDGEGGSVADSPRGTGVDVGVRFDS